MGVRRCLARSLTSLALRCALQRVQTVPAAIHSGRIPPPQPTSHGDGRLRQTPPLHRTWSVPDASSQPQLNLYLPHPPIYDKIKKLIENGYQIYSVQEVKISSEEAFLKKVGDKKDD